MNESVLKNVDLQCSQLTQNLLCQSNQFIQSCPQIFDIGLIDSTALIGSLGILVQIVATHLQYIGHSAQLWQIQLDSVTVQSHLTQVGSNTQDSKLLHLGVDALQLGLADSKMKLLVSLFTHLCPFLKIKQEQMTFTCSCVF